mgnify:CR=1 FL=1
MESTNNSQENQNKIIFNIKLNNILKRINTSGTAPTNDDIELIEQLFLEFETKHYEELNQRNIKINFNKIPKVFCFRNFFISIMGKT